MERWIKGISRDHIDEYGRLDGLLKKEEEKEKEEKTECVY